MGYNSIADNRDLSSFV